MHSTPNDIRMLAIDLDGTLFDSKYFLSTTNAGAIRKAREFGLKIVLASGRPPFAILPTIRQLNLDGLLIAYNGASLVNAETSEVIFNRPLFAQDARKAISIIRKYDLYVSWFCGMQHYTDKDCPEMNWEAHELKHKHLLVEDLLREAPEEPNKLMVVSLEKPQLIEEAWPELKKDMPQLKTYCHQECLYMEIVHQGASKETALALACGLNNIYPTQVMAIGNAMNDLGMLGFAGISVAVNNAPPYLRQVADWNVASNDEDGVAEAIERLLCLRSQAT